jgi:hypothetical protein
MNIDKLREYILYEPLTGVMYWKKVLSNRTKPGNLCGANVDSKGYGRVCFEAKQYRAHRIAWALYYGEQAPEQIDHVNGNRLDNRIANLRAATNAENCRNAKKGKNNRSGFVGVTFHKAARKWAAGIMYNRKHIYLGLYEDIQDAVNARKQAEVVYFGEFAKSANT